MRTKTTSHPSVLRTRNILSGIVPKNASISTIVKAMKNKVKGRNGLSGLNNLENGILVKINHAYSIAASNYRFKSQMRKDVELNKLKRCKKDKSFRKTILATLKPTKAKTRKQVEKYVGEHRARQANIKILLGSGIVKTNPELPSNVAKMYIHHELAESQGVEVCKRGKDWSVVPAINPYFQHTDGSTEWKNGRAVSYTRATNTTGVRSYGIVLSEKSAVFFIVEKKVEITLPEGVTWDIDDMGIRIKKGKYDFHPTAGEIMSMNPIVVMVAELERNAELQKKIELELAVEVANSAGVYVCAKDSLRVGNCLQGTIKFANNLGIDPVNHYAASQLLTMVVKNEYQRFKLVINFACRRFKGEMEKGFSLISDHRITT